MGIRRFSGAGLFVVGFIAVVLACSSDSKNSSSSALPATGNGQLVVQLVDAPDPEVDQIVVNITQVTVHSTSAGWITVKTFAPPLSIDLLTLKDKAMQLGLVDLPPGKVTQIRLYVTQDGNYVVPKGQAEPAALKVPSGYQSGIKIQGPWDITECDQTEVTLDFDGEKSIHTHQNGTGLWILRPVIKVKKSETTAVGCGDAGGGTGSECSEDSQCASDHCVAGQCGKGGNGSPCDAPADCLSESCTNQKCDPSPPNGSCRENTDCTNASCQEDGGCAPCENDEGCSGLICGEGACACHEGTCTEPDSGGY